MFPPTLFCVAEARIPSLSYGYGYSKWCSNRAWHWFKCGGVSQITALYHSVTLSRTLLTFPDSRWVSFYYTFLCDKYMTRKLTELGLWLSSTSMYKMEKIIVRRYNIATLTTVLYSQCAATGPLVLGTMLTDTGGRRHTGVSLTNTKIGKELTAVRSVTSCRVGVPSMVRVP